MSYDPGIISLGGYAYQIKVFVFMLSQIDQNISVGFELIDDISLTDKNIDKHSEEISSVLKENLKYTAIQVKKTKITNTNYKKILYNWLLEYDKYKTDIKQFLLYADKKLNPSFNLNTIDSGLLYKGIRAAAVKKKTSLMAKLKVIYNDEDFFKKAYNYILNNYKIIFIDNIDDEIYSVYKKILHWTSSENIVYKLRIKELCKIIQDNVLSSVTNKRPYVCNFEEFNSIINDIIQRITANEYRPNFSLFKRDISIDLQSKNVIDTREYQQLSLCGISQESIKNYLIHQMYYEDYSLKTMSMLKSDKIENIENTAHENFLEVKDDLILNNNDKPERRLYETTKKSNTYAVDDQIRKGVCIHLTGEDIDDEHKISWSDSV